MHIRFCYSKEFLSFECRRQFSRVGERRKRCGERLAKRKAGEAEPDETLRSFCLCSHMRVACVRDDRRVKQGGGGIIRTGSLSAAVQTLAATIAHCVPTLWAGGAWWCNTMGPRWWHCCPEAAGQTKNSGDSGLSLIVMNERTYDNWSVCQMTEVILSPPWMIAEMSRQK